MKNFSYIFLSALAALACSCSGQKGWEVSGNLNDAPADSKISLQGFNGASWFLIDSLKVEPDGNFAYSSPTPAPNPDVYRLGYNGQNIYFPIDSVDEVIVEAYANHFDTGYALAGTAAAVKMMNVDQEITNALSQKGLNYVLSDSAFKRNISDIILSDSSAVIAYYLINKNIGGQPLFSPLRRNDLKMIGAVANKFSVERPNDPRTKFLASKYLTNRPASAAPADTTLTANVVGFFDLDLYDAKGKQHKLSETVDNAGITLLSFTSYQIENSVAYNVILNRLFNQFAGNNLAIYQVALDGNEVEWMQAAQNLPWIAVRQDPTMISNEIIHYNLTTIPVTFIINKNGDLVERIDNPEELEQAIRKHI